MTFERYMELVRLADRLVAAPPGLATATDDLMVRSLTKPERKALMAMVCMCARCSRWFDQSGLPSNVKYCEPCGKATV
jgi:hypothetical protein